MPLTGWLINNSSYFSQFQRLDVWDEGAGRVSVLWGPPPGIQSSSQMERMPSAPGGSSEGALSSLGYKGTNPIHEGSTLMTSSPSQGSASTYHHHGDQVSHMDSHDLIPFPRLRLHISSPWGPGLTHGLSWPHPLPKAPPPHIITMGTRSCIWIWWQQVGWWDTVSL